MLAGLECVLNLTLVAKVNHKLEWQSRLTATYTLTNKALGCSQVPVGIGIVIKSQFTTL